MFKPFPPPPSPPPKKKKKKKIMELCEVLPCTMYSGNASHPVLPG